MDQELFERDRGELRAAVFLRAPNPHVVERDRLRSLRRVDLLLVRFLLQNLNIVIGDELHQRLLIKPGVARDLHRALLVIPPANDPVAQLKSIVRSILHRVVAVALREDDVIDVVGRLLGARVVALVDRLVLDDLVVAEDRTDERRQHLLDRRADITGTTFDRFGSAGVSFMVPS